MKCDIWRRRQTDPDGQRHGSPPEPPTHSGVYLPCRPGYVRLSEKRRRKIECRLVACNLLLVVCVVKSSVDYRLSVVALAGHSTQINAYFKAFLSTRCTMIEQYFPVPHPDSGAVICRITRTFSVSWLDGAKGTQSRLSFDLTISSSFFSK